MENPITPPKKRGEPPPMQNDPLDLDPRKDKTKFLRV